MILVAGASPPLLGTDDILQLMQQTAVPELMRSLTGKEGAGFRLRETRGDLQGRPASPYLLQAYAETTHEGVRCKLIESMGKFRDPTLFGWYLKQLTDPSPAIQTFAVWALGELRSPRAVAPLRRKLWSADPHVQMAAIDALGKTGRHPAATGELAVFLSHEDPQVRYLAAKALRGAAGPALFPTLVQRLAEEPSLEVQEALAETAGRVGGQHAVNHFVEVLKYSGSPAKEHWAEVALQNAETRWVRPALAPLLKAGDFRTRLSAARIMQRLANAVSQEKAAR